MTSVVDRMEAHIMRDPNSGCWIWTFTLNAYGYGVVRDGGKPRQAHRVMYENSRSPIGDGLVIDHLCSLRCCVNPEHMEVVTSEENTSRGHARKRALANPSEDACRNGHLRTASNIRTYKGQQICVDCQKASAVRGRQALRQYRQKVRSI